MRGRVLVSTHEGDLHVHRPLIISLKLHILKLERHLLITWPLAVSQDFVYKEPFTEERRSKAEL
jgi:hypothetical protein